MQQPFVYTKQPLIWERLFESERKRSVYRFGVRFGSNFVYKWSAHSRNTLVSGVTTKILSRTYRLTDRQSE